MRNDWTMPRHAEVCAACGRPFEIGAIFQACLHEVAAGYERRDYCLECPPSEDPAPVAAWKTRLPEPVATKLQPFDREVIYRFFERLEETDEPHSLQFRFVLALLLWRKKVLKLERSLESAGREIWEFVAPRSGAAHRVERPDLAEDELERLGAQLEQLLAGQPGDVEFVTTAGPAEDEDG